MSSRKLSSDNPPASQSKPASTQADFKQSHAASAEVSAVCIVDDDENDRLLVERILRRSSGFRLAGSHASAQAALDAIATSAPDVVLMDIRMPGMSGIECTRRLRAILPSIVIIIVSGVKDAEAIGLAAAAGSDDYLEKPLSESQLLATVKFAFLRRASLQAATLNSPSARGDTDTTHLQRLNQRERQLLQWLDDGLLYKEMADRLHGSLAGVRKHLHKMYVKLNVSNRTEAVKRAREDLSG
jgi:DNA-binding NarL/FixJ family response regulator